ncbi:type II toxin-antitoxin system VapC family toxin [Cellulomonas sp. S1-8]|uniref:type II toxin-antitoxin system VapC family toxin n=1 Tax=Cellulomonas sp. S1-8 TaxID=2904790 RepID=UPI0022445491|nr:type II toxin-antitoxin system VapC family toxin [Cellulomonas sp. S1-8]UZN03098.1 type II toxin-antitoxin system VapC family toxin [Cellulomonas sp. S1-8]
MRLLADTHVLLWWWANDPRLPARHRDVLADGGTEVLFSSVSIAEIAIEASLGKLDSPPDVAAVHVQGGFVELAFTARHAALLGTLPWHHRDPFDRTLVAQAVVEGLTIASVDARVAQYDVAVL